MFKIGDFSKLARVSIRMLRYYDEVGLFNPAKVDDFTGYRYYSAKQITKLNLIVSLRDMGFNIAEISVAVNEESDNRLKEMLSQKRDEAESKIILEQEKLKKINSAIKNLKKERVNMSYNVTLKTVPSYNVVSLRDTIPAHDKEGLLWERLSKYIEKRSIQCGNVYYATYHEEGYKEDEVDVEVVMDVEELLESDGDFVFKQSEPIKQAVSILVPGDYSNLLPAYNFLGNWIEENGYIIVGKTRQLPIKGPWNEKNTSNYLSEVQIPVEKL